MTRAKIDPLTLMHRQWHPRHSSSTHRTTDAHRFAKHGPLLPMDHPRSSLSGWAVLMILGAIAGGLLI